MKALKSKIGKQTILLFGSQLIMVLIGFGIKAIQTKFLGPEAYGIYAFFGSFTIFTALFFRFGFFSSLQVLVAENHDKEIEREYFGLGFVVSWAIGLSYGVFIWVFSFFIDAIFHTQIGDILRILSPLTVIIPTRSLISAISIGSNRVQLIPMYDYLSKGLFLIALLLFPYGDSLTIFTTILFNLLTLYFAVFILFKHFNPSFQNMKLRFQKLWSKTKSFGFDFYLGSTANQSTFKLDELAITYFLGTTTNGFYSLANMLASPMVMGSQALSNSMFKNFAHQVRIPKKVFLWNSLWLGVSILSLYVLADWIVSYLFGADFSLVSEYAIGLSIAFFFQGLYQPFNFLSAKSQGKAIRNVAITEALINLVGNLALIPILGVAGAIYTSIFAKLIHFVGKVYYYQKYLKEVGC